MNHEATKTRSGASQSVQFARATGRLEKTDPIDARVLAGFAGAVGPRVEEKPREKQAELRDLVSRRRALVQVRVAEKNRLADV